jgi:nitroreductase/NAD-dependent dihydropyrimidine dehydrogenase PreA subunit
MVICLAQKKCRLTIRRKKPMTNNIAPLIKFDTDLCTKCGICAEVCPGRVLVQKDRDSFPEVAAIEVCVSCGHCVAACPVSAVHHEAYADGSVTPIQRQLIPSEEQILEIIRARRSIRLFSHRPVEKTVIEKIIEAARFAPTGSNSQSTEFIVVQERTLLRKIAELTADYMLRVISQSPNPVTRTVYRMVAGQVKKVVIDVTSRIRTVTSAVKNGQDLILRDAPVLLLFHADETTGSVQANANLAVQNATLMAEAMGMGSFYTGFVVGACDGDTSIPTLLSLPEGHKIYGGLGLGYPKIRFENWVERLPARVRWL